MVFTVFHNDLLYFFLPCSRFFQRLNPTHLKGAHLANPMGYSGGNAVKIFIILIKRKYTGKLRCFLLQAHFFKQCLCPDLRF